MHGDGIPFGYGFWSLVVVNAAIFVLLALSFLTPEKQREWRSFEAFTGFVVALFTEMYGFPLTIYVLTAVLGSRYPVLNPFSHASGHLWITFLGGGRRVPVLLQRSVQPAPHGADGNSRGGAPDTHVSRDHGATRSTVGLPGAVLRPFGRADRAYDGLRLRAGPAFRAGGEGARA